MNRQAGNASAAAGPESSPGLQSALLRIAQLARESADLPCFYAAVHETVAGLMEATNFYIALYDAATDELQFPYFHDTVDVHPAGRPGRGLTAWVLRTGQPILVTPETFRRMQAGGEVESIGAPSVDWLGVPLKTGDRTWGVIGTQIYEGPHRLTERDKDILVFVSQHVAAAIEQKRKEEALRASELRYRQMFESNSAIKLVVDPADGRIFDANSAAVEFYGYTQEQLLSMHAWDLDTNAPEVMRELFARAMAGRQTFDVRHRLASGEERHVEVHTGPMQLDGRTLLYGIVHDVTDRRRALEALAKSEENYRNLFEYASVGILQTTRDGRLMRANTTMARILGYDSVEEMAGVNFVRTIWVDPEERERLIRLFEPTGRANDLEVQWRRKDGSPVWIHLNAHLMRMPDSDAYFEGFVTDITERKRSQELLRQQSAAMTASMDGIVILDRELRFVYANEAFAKLYAASSPDAMTGVRLHDLYDTAQGYRLLAEAIPAVQKRGRWRGEAIGRRRDGITFPQELSLTAIEGGAIAAVIRDITERTFAEEQIRHLAYHDALTGLPNRLLFKDRLTVALSHAHRDLSRVAVLFLDLDRFKVINDSLGHNIGDQLLQAVAVRIQSCIRDSDTVARQAGDEFTVMLPSLARSEDAARVASKLLEAIRQPFHVEGRELFTSTSVGISIFPEDGPDAETLIKNADIAMYQAKEQGRDNCQLFNAQVNAKALQRITLEHGLRRALDGDEMSMHYQPIVDLASGRITGMEALMRWTHPELGPIGPGVFIPVAESTGAMGTIGGWAMKTACRQAKAWHDAGFDHLSLAVNLSVTQLQQQDLVDRVRETLEETGLPPNLLELEITESGAMQSPETSIRMLFDLKRLGVRVSLDDFGTGHSSLSYLKRFPIDTLKLDQSFVRDVIVDRDTAAIVMAVIAMAHSLRLRVVAEGVETEDQASFLRNNGCDLMQGFLVKAPVPAHEFLELIRRR